MKIFRVIFLSSGGILGVILLVYYAAWKPPCVPGNIGSNEENLINKSNFFAFKEPGAAGNIGGEADRLKTEFENFKPDILLVEGKKDFFLPVIMDPVAKFGVAGRARELAVKNNIGIYSTDMPEENIYAELIKKYPARNVEAAMVLNSYLAKRISAPVLKTEYELRECLKEKRIAGLCREIKSVSDFKSVVNPEGINITSLSLSGKGTGMVDTILADIKNLRTGYIARLINYFLKQNKKVFMVYKLPYEETAFKLKEK